MTTHSIRLVLTLTTLFVTMSAGSIMAYDHDNKGWYDEHHHHAFIRHNGHRGYWDYDQGGAKVFITI